MRPVHILATAIVLAGGSLPSAWAADPLRISACPSREKAAQVIGSEGKFSPDGCRLVTVTRVQSPEGPICVIDFGTQGNSIVGAITDAALTTQWWTACGNLRSP